MIAVGLLNLEFSSLQLSPYTASAISKNKVMTLVSAKLAAGTLEVVIQESPDGNSSYVSKLLPKKN